MRGAALLLLLLAPLLLSGCTGGAGPTRVVAGEGIVVNETDGAANVSLASTLRPRVVQVCAGPCDTLTLPEGLVVAERGVASLGNISLNAVGPDGDSALYFFEGGEETGRFLRWSDVAGRFQLNADVQVVGNVTATGHVGTTTPLVLQSGAIVALSTAALEGTEQAVFYRGSGSLANGTYQFTTPSVLAAIGDFEGHVTAQATLTSDGPAIFVAEKGPDRFVFRAVGGADVSGVTFDYFIQVPRKGTAFSP